MDGFESAFGSYKLIYVFSLPNDKDHEGLLKVGETTIKTDKEPSELNPSCKDLNDAARERIKKETHVAAMRYELHHTELAITNDGKAFSDHDVHNVLERSNIKHKKFKEDYGFEGGKEWFPTDLETIQKAIKAVKEKRLSLDPSEITEDHTPIIFRKEQQDAIDRTLARFGSGKKNMLWYAKMRFGKTLTLMKLVKDMGLQRTIIITHRPVVEEGWFEDFKKLFYDAEEYHFASRDYGEEFKDVEKLAQQQNDKYLYFASIPDLRGSKIIGGNFDKNTDIFGVDWDLVVIDEAHEGTQTELGQKVIDALVNDKEKQPYLIQLSGTPFNLLDNIDEDGIFTWDYIMEQKAKADWSKNHRNEPNPYAGLPKMNIFTYNMARINQGKFRGYIDDKFFNFAEFFRTNEDGNFVHLKDVEAFLDLMVRSDDNNYPFSNEYNRKNFRHSLWMVPGVKEAKALSALLKQHPVFSQFNIANVAGDGDEETNFKDALDAVKKAITDKPDETFSITISCGRLTTGVTVPAWTAVFMMAGSSSTSASSYMQTIFRVQSPANINGRIKENCFVFDFAPDRSLKCFAESVKISTRTGHNTTQDRRIMETLLEFCPIVAINDSQMTPYNVNNMMEQLKKVYIDRIVRHGFDDPNLFNNDLLLQLDEHAMNKFIALQKLVASSAKGADTSKSRDIIINENGVNEQGQITTIEPSPLVLTEEERIRREEQAEIRKNKDKAVKILKGIAIRIPMLIYGSEKEITQDFDIEEFINDIDQVSWVEFMPRGVDKEVFKQFIKYFDRDAFIGAGKEIRNRAAQADRMEPTTRVRFITSLISTFKNPDNETVLTPWKVVNMHMGTTIGGFNFYDDEYASLIPDTESPRYIEIQDITKDIFESQDAKILELNSKSGLYPLYITYTLWRKKCNAQNLNLEKINIDDNIKKKAQEIWDKVVSNNVYVICKTQMAKSITQRTLCGYRDIKVNAHSFENLVKKLKDGKSSKFIEKAKTGATYNSKNKEKDMKFSACVSNPPYQDGHQQLYPYFYLAARKLSKYVSMIFPIGWQRPSTANGLSVLNNTEIKEDKQIMFIDNRQNVFPGIAGAEWTNIILWKKDYDNGLNGRQCVYTNGKNLEKKKLLINKEDVKKPEEINSIVKKVNKLKEEKIYSLVSPSKPYGLRADPLDNPDKYGIIVTEQKSEETVRLFGIKSKNRTFINIEKSGLPKRSPLLDNYKLFVPKAWGNMDEKTGFLGGSYSEVLVAEPGDCCSETYLEVGPFKDKKIAENAKKYFYTKFFRAVFYKNKMSQNTACETYQSVPMQDFSPESDVPWSKSIKEIDEFLYNKYGLNQTEIDFVESRIKPME